MENNKQFWDDPYDQRPYRDEHQPKSGYRPAGNRQQDSGGQQTGPYGMRDQHRPGYDETGAWIGAPDAFQGNRDYYRGGIGFMGGGDYRIVGDDGDNNRSGRSDRLFTGPYDEEPYGRGTPPPQGGQHRGKGPRGYQRSPQRIHEDVCERLADDPHVDASEIDVRVEGTEVVITGTVHSRAEKRRVEDLVDSVSGVTQIQNQLRIS